MSQSRQLAAIMFTDIVGYTAIMGEDEDHALSLLRINKEIHLKWLKKFNGKWLKEMGDGVLASFNSAIDAVYCAGAIQKELEDIDHLQLRIGIHLGDVVIEGKEIYGDGVNIASRIMGIAQGGEVVVSDSIYQIIKNKPGLVSHAKGTHRVKNVSVPLSVYVVEYSPSESYESFSSTPRSGRKRLIAAAVVLITLLSGYLFYLAFSSRSQPTAPVTNVIHSLAVLPFENLTGDTTQNNIISGMHDNLITALAEIKAVDVISRTSTLAYQHRGDKTIPGIARELGVDAIIEASVLSSNDRLRLNVQLIQALPSEKHLWAKVFDSPFQDVLQVFDQVCQDILKEINATLASDHRSKASREINPEAYRAYLNGKFYLDNNPTQKNVTNALNYFERSIALDSTFAPAYAGVALVWISRFQLKLNPGTEAVPRIYAYNQKALDLNADYPESHYIKALVSFQSEWDWNKSEAAFKTAIKANPSHALAHAHYAHLLMNLQRFDEAIAQAEEAYRLDPLSPHILGLYGIVLGASGQLGKAIEIVGRDSLSFGRRGLEERFAYLQGDYEKSIDLLEINFGSDSLMFKTVREQYLKNGYQAAMGVIARYLDKIPLFSAVGKAVFFCRAGLTDDAIRVLEEGYKNHDTDMPYAFVPVELKQLESDPRYRELARKMSLPV